ncbi:hypothetical protein C8R44DRAFT_725918 [Mycena epipterygia]|nr:hypothetical protein C8R44DRAFT_725918 [Mycena epipterygia]
MYHSLRSSEDNEEIVRLLEEDPRCQVVIATIAFAKGLNIKTLLDSISLGFPETVDQLWQEKGRVGRNPDTAARGVVLFQPSVLAEAKKQLAGPVASPTVPKINPKTGKPVRKKKTKPMEHAKALVLVEQRCYIAAINRIYQNPPTEITYLDCIAAKRRLPCSLCADRTEKTLNFTPSPLPPGIVLAPFTPPTTQDSAPLSAAEKKLKLTKKEMDMAEGSLVSFGETVRLAERKHITNQHRPKSSYFPASLIHVILNKLLSLDSLAALSPITQSWTFAIGHVVALYAVVAALRTTIQAEREEARINKNAKQRATRKAKKGVRDIDSESEESGEEESSYDEDEADEHPRSSPIPPPPKRAKTVLAEVTNRQRPARRPQGPREKQLDAETVAATFRPAYRTSRRRGNAVQED